MIKISFAILKNAGFQDSRNLERGNVERLETGSFSPRPRFKHIVSSHFDHDPPPRRPFNRTYKLFVTWTGPSVFSEPVPASSCTCSSYK